MVLSFTLINRNGNFQQSRDQPMKRPSAYVAGLHHLSTIIRAEQKLFTTLVPGTELCISYSTGSCNISFYDYCTVL